MAKYRFLVADLLTNTIREELPLSDVSFRKVLNRPGAFAASIPLRHPKATRANLDPGKTSIYVERDGVILWGGILWTVKSSGTEKIVIGGEGFWSYFRKRLIRVTKTYAAQDQLFIARDLMNYAQGITNGNIGVTVGSETSGVNRDRTYYHYERKPIGESIEQLSAVDGGFDFAIDCAWSGSSITKTFVLSYPRRGRTTQITLDLATNVEGLEWEIDATKQANSVDALGAGNGDSMLISTASDPGTGYPLYEDAVSYKDVTVQATLNKWASSWLAQERTPVETLPTIMARDTAEAAIGSFIEGDVLNVVASDGFVSINGQYRVVGYKIAVDQNGRESCALDLAQAGAFAA